MRIYCIIAFLINTTICLTAEGPRKENEPLIEAFLKKFVAAGQESLSLDETNSTFQDNQNESDYFEKNRLNTPPKELRWFFNKLAPLTNEITIRIDDFWNGSPTSPIIDFIFNSKLKCSQIPEPACLISKSNAPLIYIQAPFKIYPRSTSEYYLEPSVSPRITLNTQRLYAWPFNAIEGGLETLKFLVNLKEKYDTQNTESLFSSEEAYPQKIEFSWDILIQLDIKSHPGEKNIAITWKPWEFKEMFKPPEAKRLFENQNNFALDHSKDAALLTGWIPFTVAVSIDKEDYTLTPIIQKVYFTMSSRKLIPLVAALKAMDSPIETLSKSSTYENKEFIMIP